MTPAALTPPPAPDGFKHSVSIEVRFGDLDALGHVNNAKFLTYLEIGRLHYAQDVLGWDGEPGSLGVILARVEVDFQAPVFFQDVVFLYSRVAGVGNKSMNWEHVFLARRRDGSVAQAAQARVVGVMYDYAANATVRVPDGWRAAAHHYDGAPVG